MPFSLKYKADKHRSQSKNQGNIIYTEKTSKDYYCWSYCKEHMQHSTPNESFPGIIARLILHLEPPFLPLLIFYGIGADAIKRSYPIIKNDLRINLLFGNNLRYLTFADQT